MKKGIALLLLVLLFVLQSIKTSSPDQDPFLITDYSRLHPVKVERVVRGKEEEQLVAILKEAKDKHLTISIAGQRHSQGGHTYYKDGIVVDMTSFNKIIFIDSLQKKIQVQAGATWKDVQDAVNPYGLAVKTMQSQNIFTIGGSISINAHGRDIRHGSLIKSVESFRLLTADGQIREVSRTENADLFSFALGGYGLFGIILDVTLTLTEDEIYRIETEETNVSSYAHYFREHVQADRDIQMHIARISVADDGYLSEMYAINYRKDTTIPLAEHNKLKTQEEWVVPLKMLFNLNRSFGWGRNALWSLQKSFFMKQQNSIVSRNNAMSAESEFMDYHEAGKNDLLQEYFIPVDDFAGFVQDLKKVLPQDKLNLLNITVRFVNHDQEAVLSYAREDMFALVCLFNVSLSDSNQAVVQREVQHIIELVIRHHGTYYLPYAAYPTVEQFKEVYPESQLFFKKKDEYDPEHRFMNYFYEQYRGDLT